MKRPPTFYGFLGIYFGLIFFSFLANQIYFQEITSTSSAFNYSVALASLTQINGDIVNSNISTSFSLYSILISQLAGIIFLSYLLWLYRNLFGSQTEKKLNFGSALRLTILITFLSEIVLFIFFLYAIPIELTDLSFQKKVIAAISLAVGSFTNSGFSTLAYYFKSEVISQNFVLQIGIIAGAFLGNLGIFVVYELLSPIKLRERLANPDIDWSFITKISVYGGILILALGSGIFYVIESNGFLSDKNIIESVIASIYEISSARAFGNSLSETIDSPGSNALKLFISAIGSGPFSTGGGLTLLSLYWIFSLVTTKDQKSIHSKISNSVFKYLLIYSIIIFCLPTIYMIVLKYQSNTVDLLLDQANLFVSNHSIVDSDSDWSVILAKSITNISGRVGFILVCFITLKQTSK